MPKKKKHAKKRVTSKRRRVAKEPLAIDVTPADLIDGGRRIHFLRDLLDEIDIQWPQGREPKGNGHGSRIGTMYVYFDEEDVLHLAFIARGSYLKRKGGLKKVPKCKPPSWILSSESE